MTDGHDYAIVSGSQFHRGRQLSITTSENFSATDNAFDRAGVDRATNDRIAQTKRLIDAHLDRLLTSPQSSPITEAMRYSVLAPGKRMRPLLTLAVSEFFGKPLTCAMQVACAIEMIHCASLILDDLPCMDNDRERRSRLSTHVEFGEDLTILAAVSLLTHGHCTIAAHEALDADLRLKLVQLLCEAVGPRGLSLGQYVDLNAKPATSSAASITDIHHLKTGVLFLAAAKAGCLVSDAALEQQEKVLRYTRNIGLAFQLMDDVKDVDEAGTNMVARIGVSNAERKIREYLQAADSAIEDEDNAAVLQNFSRAFFKRV
jgi:geranylgeranyl diphosphate synthase type II